MHTEFY